MSWCVSVCVCAWLWKRGVGRGSAILSVLHLKKFWLGKNMKENKSLSEMCSKFLHNFKAFGLAGLFVWVNEMRGQACHNPNAQCGNKFPKADLHNSIRNGPKGSVTKIILSDWLQALYFKLKTHSSRFKRGQRKQKSLLVFCSLYKRDIIPTESHEILLSRWKYRTVSITDHLPNHYLNYLHVS